MNKLIRTSAPRAPSRPHANAQAQLDALIDRSGGPGACHIFTGRIITNRGPLGGYGRVSTTHLPGAEGERRHVYAHVLAYVLAYGPVPEGQEVAHSAGCNVLCCNPSHLRATSHADNLADSIREGRGALPLAKAIEIDKIMKLTGGKVNKSKLARAFRTTRGVVDKILTGPSWRCAIEGGAA